MVFLISFIAVGILGRGLNKPLRTQAENWKRDSLELLRLLGISCAVIGFFFGAEWKYLMPSLFFAAGGWMGLIAFQELRRRGSLDKELRSQDVRLRGMDERLQHLGPQASSTPRPRGSRGGISPDATSAGAEPVSRWPRAHEETGHAHIPEIVVDAESGMIDISDLIAEATADEQIAPAHSADADQGTENLADVLRRRIAENEARERAAALADDEADAFDSTEAVAAEHSAEEEQHEQAAAEPETEPETEAAAEAEAVHVHPERTQPAGYNSGPVKIGSGNLGSLFSSTEAPIHQRSSGPLTSLGGSIPHYELDLRSSRQLAKEAADAKSD